MMPPFILFFMLLSLATPSNPMNIYTMQLGHPVRPTTSDEGFKLCGSEHDCDRLKSFSCSSLDGPNCAAATNPQLNLLSESTAKVFSKLMGKILQALISDEPKSSAKLKLTLKGEKVPLAKPIPKPKPSILSSPPAPKSSASKTSQTRSEQPIEHGEHLEDVLSNSKLMQTVQSQLLEMVNGDQNALTNAVAELEAAVGDRQGSFEVDEVDIFTVDPQTGQMEPLDSVDALFTQQPKSVKTRPKPQTKKYPQSKPKVTFSQKPARQPSSSSDDDPELELQSFIAKLGQLLRSAGPRSQSPRDSEQSVEFEVKLLKSKPSSPSASSSSVSPSSVDRRAPKPEEEARQAQTATDTDSETKRRKS
jgi:hypothetical protein